MPAPYCPAPPIQSPADKYGTTVRRDEKGRIIVDDANEIAMTRAEAAAAKAAKEEHLKTPNGVYEQRCELLRQKLIGFTEGEEFDALWKRYESFAVEAMKEFFSPDAAQVEKAIDRLDMADDTDGALRCARHAFTESTDDMVWMLTGHMYPGEAGK